MKTQNYLQRIAELKILYRAECLEKRRGIPSEEKQSASQAIAAQIQALSSFLLADSVLLYAAFRGEVDVSTLFDTAIAHGKKVYYPRCEGEIMHFHRVTSREQLLPGKYDILEPSLDREIYIPDQDFHASVCIVPGLAFNRRGYRLGYGRGYYDRFLPKYNGTKIGVTYDILLVERIPKLKFDQPVDAVVTERDLYLVAK